MGQTVYVLFDGELPSKAALARCFEELGFPLAFERDTSPLDAFPVQILMRLRGEETGVSFLHYTDLDGFRAEEGFEARFTRVAAFRFFADELASAIAICLGTAIAKLTDGAVFHSSERGAVPLERALGWARQQLESTERTEVARPTTRRQDLRPYLRSLLKQRSDLALSGRSLLIRPVRHVLRYAYFEPTFDRYVVRVLRKCVPLFTRRGSTRHVVDHVGFEIWQPYFESMLIDSLACDVFDEIGAITTLSDLAAVQRDGFDALPRITSLVLAGEQGRALALVEEVERTAQVDGRAKHPAREHWERMSKDIAAACAECHEQEARSVEAMKLHRYWEPSPFPVEARSSFRKFLLAGGAGAHARRLFAEKCAADVSEPAFTGTPWPERPPWLWQDVPHQPGEIRYAKNFVRHGGTRLLVALTREEAEERHREWERYTLAARLPDGLLVLVSRVTAWDRLHPQDPDRVEREEPRIHVVLDGGSHIAAGTIVPDEDDPSLARFAEFTAHPRSGSPLERRLSFEEGGKAIRDDRGGKTVPTYLALTAAERDLATVPKPAFGEYELLAERLRALLQIAGHGGVS
jgi:hypothetical protein